MYPMLECIDDRSRWGPNGLRMPRGPVPISVHTALRGIARINATTYPLPLREERTSRWVSLVCAAYLEDYNRLTARVLGDLFPDVWNMEAYCSEMIGRSVLGDSLGRVSLHNVRILVRAHMAELTQSSPLTGFIPFTVAVTAHAVESRWKRLLEHEGRGRSPSLLDRRILRELSSQLRARRSTLEGR